MFSGADVPADSRPPNRRAGNPVAGCTHHRPDIGCSRRQMMPAGRGSDNGAADGRKGCPGRGLNGFQQGVSDVLPTGDHV